MKTWKVWSMHAEGSRYNVYAAQLDGAESLNDTIVVAEGVSGNEASDLVRGFRPPDDPKACYNFEACSSCGGPLYHP